MAKTIMLMLPFFAVVALVCAVEILGSVTTDYAIVSGGEKNFSGGSVDQFTSYLHPNQVTTPSFSAYPACTSALSGSIANMMGNASAWGATVSGNGSNNVMARCNGTTGNWTVMGD